MRAGSRAAYPRWAPLALSRGVVTMHREVMPGVYVGGARVPRLDWFPASPGDLFVVDLRCPDEPLPERVGPDDLGGGLTLDDLRARGFRYEAHPLRLGPDGLPADGAAYRRAVDAAFRAWPRWQVLLASRDGVTRAPLVAYGALRSMGMAGAAALKRVGTMVAGELPEAPAPLFAGLPSTQSPSADAVAWAEARLRESDAGPSE